MIEDFVGEHPEIDHRAARARFRRVIEHHVQQHLDPGRVHRIDERTELLRRAPKVRRYSQDARVEAMRAVAPVIDEADRCSRCRHVLLIESHHRQQLHVRDAQILQIGIFSISPENVPGKRETPLDESRANPPTCSS